MKHTPGPWEYRPAMNYSGYCVAPLGTLPTLAACERFGENLTITCFNFPGSTEANARLIAAAPELLEVLITVMKPFEWISDENLLLDWQREARAAIAKAKGEQS